MNHLTERELSAMADSALKGEDLWRAERHLEGCDACRGALAGLSARDATIGAALTHDPGEEYFATFADRVVGRIANAEAAGEADAPVRGAAAAAGDMLRPPFRLAWWQSPRGLAMAGTVTAVVAGAGLVLMTARQAEMPPAGRDLSPAARATQQAPMANDSESRAGAEGRADGKGQAGGSLRATDPESDALRDASTQAPLERQRANVAKQPANATSPVPPAAPAPAPLESEVAGRREAAGTRMRQVPRGATGEQRGTSPAPTVGFAVPPRAADEQATTPEKLRELKRRALGPAGQKQEAAETLQGQSSDLAATAPAAPGPALSKAAVRDLGAGSQAETRAVCGRVRDDSGRPLAGVNVTAIDAARTTTSGADGRFCLELPPGAHTLQLLAVGFRPSRLSISGDGTGGELAATLMPVSVLGTGAGASPSSLSLGDMPLRGLSDSLRTVVDRAARLQARAISGTGPSGYEAAALAWERLLPGVNGAAAEVEIRARIAECRFSAWQRSRDGRRAGRAVEALTSYIGRAPAGDRRDLAARWIDQLRPR
ncbi:MAG: carboxypeptidase regulatory-like domain-containing protein [Candidatus Eisenbacteria bacterium]